ncbi:hypothetical protein BGZ60DRAFT_191796 [Tricladium varicosporioides]|nr:hypothetical protein BGZ60DRAFT_191796 [Hymenoscyphus varicosporioides]
MLASSETTVCWFVALACMVETVSLVSWPVASSTNTSYEFDNKSVLAGRSRNREDHRVILKIKTVCDGVITMRKTVWH